MLARLTLLLLLPIFVNSLARLNAAEPSPSLRLGVYATAGDIQQHLITPALREKTAPLLQSLHVSRLWLEGRRGDETVPASQLAEIRDFFASRGIDCAGGIATVPGANFGTRQNAELGWLNWESAETQNGVSRFFSEHAPEFQTLIIDDFYCTADTSPASDRARGSRSWSQYRRDLLVSLIEPMILQPARTARPDVKLIIKYPQWYDRFHLFGYDPVRMSPYFDAVWVGTEVRNPQTRRMGFVQPTEGYVNFRWLSSIAGDKARGAWFDHIECEPDHFLDQAYQSVLAGARELTLFRLGDLVQGHPGDQLLAQQWPDLVKLHHLIRDRPVVGLPVYQPANSASDDNLYLMDYLAMIGLPIVPTAAYPSSKPAVLLPVQAASDPHILARAEAHLEQGATLIVTPAFLRIAGPRALELAGLSLTSDVVPVHATRALLDDTVVPLDPPLDVDGGVKTRTAQAILNVAGAKGAVPLLTAHPFGNGRLLTLNVRTFAESDFREAGEWLLAPKPLGLPAIPRELADRLRAALLEPLDITFLAPPGIALYLFDHGACLYSFKTETARVTLNRQSFELPSKRWLWLPNAP